MSIYGLADCNNFFVACERVFRPALEGRPAVVLSSNDGCIVARSDEAKALGVKMAQPAFQAKDLIERHSIAVISGNLQFYTDMSNRVMQAFGELVPAVEKYSIDECFLDLTGIPQELTAFCQDLKRTVRQWTGLPISIGIAETKTLAKIANRLAKTSAKTDGVLDLTGTRWRDKALASTEVGDIWGIGRQYAQKLNRNGIMTALDLTSRPDGWIRKEMGVGGLKTVRELRGEDCIGFDDMPQPKQTTMVSRSGAGACELLAPPATRASRDLRLCAAHCRQFVLPAIGRTLRCLRHTPCRTIPSMRFVPVMTSTTRPSRSESCSTTCPATSQPHFLPSHSNVARNILNRLLSVVRSRTDKIIELSRAALTVPRYGESNRLVGVD